jgi:ATP-dependent DNA helicase RecQ
VLSGKTEVILGLPRDAVKPEGSGRKWSGAADGLHQALFDTLRGLRKKIADAANVPPFVVFSDATLLELAAAKPRNEREMLAVSGIGEHKLRKYGAAFLSAINGHHADGA